MTSKTFEVLIQAKVRITAKSRQDAEEQARLGLDSTFVRVSSEYFEAKEGWHE